MSNIQYDKSIFAKNLQRLMDENMSRQADIARLLGVSRSTVSAYCKGMQIPRMDKIEQLSQHFGVSTSELLEEKNAVITELFESKDDSPIVKIFNELNDDGKDLLLDYGQELLENPEYQAEKLQELRYIKHYLVPAAAGYAAPIQGEDYELIERDSSIPSSADFCISISGDSMEPYIHDGQRVYVSRDTPEEFEVGVFFVDGDVFCKQWCVDYSGTLHLLSANEKRQDANISIPRDSSRSCICFGKVLLKEHLPRPIYL